MTAKLFNKYLGEHPLIIIGETHGARENVNVIKFFVKKTKPDIIFFEWPKSWLSYITDKRNNIDKPDCEDGRIGAEHVVLIEKLRTSGIEIIAMDNEEVNWNKRDEGFARTIRNKLNLSGSVRAIAILGNLHARNKPFKMKINGKTKQLIPAGYLLRDIARSVNIRYGKAQIRNFGIHSFSDKYVLKNLKRNENFSFRPIKNPINFDFDILVRNTKPTSEIV